jgi:hypothetical protein
MSDDTQLEQELEIRNLFSIKLNRPIDASGVSHLCFHSVDFQ